MERYEKVEFSTWNIFGKNTETWSLTAKRASALCSVTKKKKWKCASTRVSNYDGEKKMCIYLYVTEEICTIDGESRLIISCLFSRQPRWIRSFKAALLSLNRKLSGTSGMTAQAVWRQEQILPGRIGNDCSKRSLSKCSHTKTNLSSLRSDKHTAPFKSSPCVSSATTLGLLHCLCHSHIKQSNYTLFFPPYVK